MRAALPLVLLLSVCSAGLSPAHAGPADPAAGVEPREDRAFHGRHKFPRLDAVLEENADRLGLDKGTRDRIRAIAEASRAEEAPLDGRIGNLHREMRRMLGEPSPDEGAVLRQADRIGELRTERHKHRLRTMLQIRALLTPAQREELVRIFDEKKLRRSAP